MNLIKNLIFGICILVSFQNGLHAMEQNNLQGKEDQEEKIFMWKGIMRARNKELEDAKDDLELAQKRIKRYKAKKQNLKEQLKQPSLHEIRRQQFQQDLQEAELCKKQAQLDEKKWEAIIKHLEQETEQLKKRQEVEQLNWEQLQQLRQEKLAEHEKLLIGYGIRKKEVDKEIERYRKAGIIPGKLVIEKQEQENAILTFVKKCGNSLEEKILVVPAKEWASFLITLPKRMKWRADQKNTNLKIIGSSNIKKDMADNVNLTGSVEIVQEDIHDEGKLDSVIISFDENWNIKHTIKMDKTANIGFPETCDFRLAKNLACAKNQPYLYKEIIDSKIIGGAAGLVGGGIFAGLLAYKGILSESSAKAMASGSAAIGSLFFGINKKSLEEKVEAQNELDAADILKSSEGIQQSCGLDIINEPRSYNEGEIKGKQFFVVNDQQKTKSKQDLINIVVNKYPGNGNLFIIRPQLLNPGQEQFLSANVKE